LEHALPFFDIRDHDIDFALQNDVELGAMVSILEYALSFHEVFILKLLAQVRDVLTHHIPLLEEIDLLEDWSDQREVFVLSLLLRLHKNLDHCLKEC